MDSEACDESISRIKTFPTTLFSVPLCQGCRLTQIEFINTCLDRNLLVNFLVSHGCIADRKSCTKCGEVKEMNTKAFNFYCGKKNAIYKYNGRKKIVVKCNWKESAKRGTLFGYAKLTTKQICLFVMYWMHHPAPRRDYIYDNLKLGANSVVDYSRFCREICEDWALEETQILGGSRKTVELAEAEISQRKFNKGQGSKITGQYVYSGFERETKNIFFVPVETRSLDALLSIVQDYILPDTIIVSDCWKLYDCLEHPGFLYEIEYNNKLFLDFKTGMCQQMTRFWKEVRGGIPRYGKGKHYSSYLAEFLFKRTYESTLDRIHHFFIEIGKSFPIKP